MRTVIAFTAPWVPTGMKAGVSTSPCGVDITPLRAAPSVCVMLKENMAPVPGTQPPESLLLSTS